MLIDFTTQNYRSFKDSQTLSLAVGRGKHDDKEISFSTKTPNTTDLLRSAVIYGPNAAGKSNLIHAMYTMMSIVISGVRKGEELPAEPFLFNSESSDQPTEFECHFVSKGIRYRYGFSFSTERIYDEWLYSYPKGQRTILFERFINDSLDDYEWKFGPSLKGEKTSWRGQTRENALFLSVAVDLNSEQLSPIYDWFMITFRAISVDGPADRFTASLCQNKEEKEKILAFLKAADLHIDDFRVRTRTIEESVPENLPDNLKDEVLKHMSGHEFYDIQSVHRSVDGKEVLMDFEDESDGTQRMFELAGPWIDSLENGYVVIVDELDTHLHPILLKFLLNLFQNPKINKNNAQLIFTTHDVTTLSQKLLRRDQVWFADKNKDNSTEIFSLMDFLPKKSVENIMLGYMTGRYEALPKIKETVFEKFFDNG